LLLRVRGLDGGDPAPAPAPVSSRPVLFPDVLSSCASSTTDGTCVSQPEKNSGVAGRRDETAGGRRPTATAEAWSSHFFASVTPRRDTPASVRLLLRWRAPPLGLALAPAGDDGRGCPADGPGTSPPALLVLHAGTVRSQVSAHPQILFCVGLSAGWAHVSRRTARISSDSPGICSIWAAHRSLRREEAVAALLLLSPLPGAGANPEGRVPGYSPTPPTRRRAL
jgi:hypothetical protein